MPIALGSLPYFPIAYYAILKLGAIVVPLNILLKAPEIAYHLRDSDASVFLCFEGWGARLIKAFVFEGGDAVEVVGAPIANPAEGGSNATGSAAMRVQMSHKASGSGTCAY